MASSQAAHQCAPVPVKLDARELGERLAADAWASADRLLLCLCLRAWRLQRGRVAVKTPPVQLQGAKAARARSWYSPTVFSPPSRHLEESSPWPFDFAAGESTSKPQRRKEELQRCFSAWRDEADASALVKAKMEEMRLEERLEQETFESREASPKSQARATTPSWKDDSDYEKSSRGRTRNRSTKVSVDLTEREPIRTNDTPSPKVTAHASPSEGSVFRAEQRLAEAEQALAESLWQSQQGQRMSRLEVKAERHLRTHELIDLRLAWQAWEEVIKERRQAHELVESPPGPPDLKQVAASRQGLQPMQSGRVRQRGYTSWDGLTLGEKASKTPDKAEFEVVPGHGIQGWIRERSDLHMQIQLLKDLLDKERREAHESASSSQLALGALQEELQMEKGKMRTKGILERAYLQSEITSQDAQRLKAERALETVRMRALARRINPRILGRAFRAWVRTSRQTIEAVSMLKQLPSADRPRRLRFLIEDAERGSFSAQLENWLDDRSEEEQMHDARSLLKDQAQVAILEMGKVMKKANERWAENRLRIQLFRGFSLTRCHALENLSLLSIIMFCWARSRLDFKSMDLAVKRSCRVAKPFELAEYFYLWQALNLQSNEMDKVLGRTMRGSLALSSAGGGFSNTDLVKLSFSFWCTHCGFAHRTLRIIQRYIPLQDSSLLSLVFTAWIACVHVSVNERASCESIRAETAADMDPESPANAPLPHPAPERPSETRSSRASEPGDRPEANAEEETAEQKEARLVTEAVRKAGSMLEVVRIGANAFQIGEKNVQVQIRGDQVLAKQGQAFVPLAKAMGSAGSATSRMARTPPRALQGAAGGSVPGGGATPPGARTPRSAPSPKAEAKPRSTTPPQTPKAATPKAATPSAPSRSATPSRPATPKAPSPKARAGAPGAAGAGVIPPSSPRSAVAKVQPKAKTAGPSSLLNAMAKAQQRR